jgi:transposase
MWRTLGISETDWRQTPAAVQTKLLGAHLEAHSLKLRSVSHHKQIGLLNEPDSQIKLLVEKVNSQQKQIVRLQNKLARTDALAAQVARLTAEVAHLKEKLGQNSSNSSLPPSTDSPFKKKFPMREPSRLKQGAQKGHQGCGRNLRPVSEVDRVIELRPDACSLCGSLLLGDDHNPARRQVTEITAHGTKLIEYRRHALHCLSCRQINRADWSEETKGGAFGARVVAIVGYLTGRLNISICLVIAFVI